jgi:hypothetical protein
MNLIFVPGLAVALLVAGVLVGNALKARANLARKRRLEEIHREVSRREHELQERLRGGA